ncbi:MAG: hypothetical protein H0U27_01370 [Nitrosopumilus sp.]|nr:hypothetical protein [Nitrosopumilus sp.]
MKKSDEYNNILDKKNQWKIKIQKNTSFLLILFFTLSNSLIVVMPINLNQYVIAVGTGLKVNIHVNEPGLICVYSEYQDLGCKNSGLSVIGFQFDEKAVPIGGLFTVCFKDKCTIGSNKPAPIPEEVYIGNSSNSSNRPDLDCLFNTDLSKCAVGPEGCPEGFFINGDDQCVPIGGCPNDYHTVDEDESGQCIPNTKGCPTNMIFRPDYDTCGPKEVVCLDHPELTECKSQ